MHYLDSYDHPHQALNSLAACVHDDAVEAGRYDDDCKKSPLESCALIVSEVAELMEPFRRNAPLAVPSDHAPDLHLSAVEEEIADIIIRTLDFAAALGIDVDRAIAMKHAYNRTRGLRHGGKTA